MLTEREAWLMIADAWANATDYLDGYRVFFNGVRLAGLCDCLAYSDIGLETWHTMRVRLVARKPADRLGCELWWPQTADGAAIRESVARELAEECRLEQ